MKRSWRRRKFVPPRTSLAGRNAPQLKETPVASPNPVEPKKRRTALQAKHHYEEKNDDIEENPAHALVAPSEVSSGGIASRAKAEGSNVGGRASAGSGEGFESRWGSRSFWFAIAS